MGFGCSVARAYHQYVFRESSVTTFKLFKIQSQSLSIDVVLVGRIYCGPFREAAESESRLQYLSAVLLTGIIQAQLFHRG